MCSIRVFYYVGIGCSCNIATPGLGHTDVEEGLGVGVNGCVLPTRHHGYYLVQTTDLYPNT